MITSLDRDFMKTAFLEAQKANGFNLPNPFVGAIIVIDKQIVAKAYHAFDGQEHAEILAIKKARKQNITLNKATIYVTLAPCSTTGRTGACTDALIQAKIARVVYSSSDPLQPNTDQILRVGNIEVDSGVLKRTGDFLNRIFLWNCFYKKTYVTLKMATTLDGYYATSKGDSKWITSEKMRTFARKKRAFYQAIMIGYNTLVNDDPELTVRLNNYSNPVVIILTNHSIDFGKFKLAKTNVLKIVVTGPKAKISKHPRVLHWKMPTSKFEINALLEKLWNYKIKSLLVEGGSLTQKAFLGTNQVNEIDLYFGNKILGDSTARKAFNFQTCLKMNQALSLELLSSQIIDNQIYSNYKVK